MPRIQIPFSLRSYQGRTRVASIERLVNLYPERVESFGTNTTSTPRVVLIGAPGVRPFVSLPEGDETEVNGLHSAGGFVWAVSREGVYRITPETGYIKKIGSGSFGKFVTMADNLNSEIGTQIWFCDGSRGYVIETTTLTLIPITDPAFQQASSTSFINGYAVWSRRASGQFFWSAIQDATDYNALDFATAESDSDNIARIVNVANDIWIFGENDTIEPWTTTGQASPAFRRIGNSVMRPGTASGASVVVMDDVVVWVGGDLSVYASSGGSFGMQRISQHQGVEHDLNEFGANGAYAFGTWLEGHRWYWLQIPGANKTWVYGFSSGSWFERSSFDTDANCYQDYVTGCYNTSYGPHLSQNNVRHKGVNYIGHKGGIGILDLNETRDLSCRIQREAVSAPIEFSQQNTIINSIELEFQTNCNLKPDVKFCCDKNPTEHWEFLDLSHSDDLGNTWSPPRSKDLSRAKPVQFNNRETWAKNGSARRRAWRWRTFTDRPIVFAGSIFDVEVDNAA